MWTERDQIQAYQFLRRRLVSALVTSDPNHPTSPHRRLVMGTVLGTVATMLTAAGFGISGMMAPSPPPDWQHTGLVILDSDGGGRYVLDNTGVLHPVTNLASARLLANGVKTVSVTTKLLGGTPRGATLGIANAPDMLPDPAGVITAPAPSPAPAPPPTSRSRPARPAPSCWRTPATPPRVWTAWSPCPKAEPWWSRPRRATAT